MAFNIQNVKNALNPAASTVPPGWQYDAPMDQYVNDQGLRVDALEAARHGNLIKAIINIHGPQALQATTGHISQSAGPADVITNGQWASNPFGFTKVDTTNFISIDTKVGRVGINIETGDITVPPGIGRDEAIREFWFGFQKVFQPNVKAKYEKEIADLKDDIQKMKEYYSNALDAASKKSSSVVAEKVRKKYGNEKFIMVKPEDLIRFIEE